MYEIELYPLFDMPIRPGVLGLPVVGIAHPVFPTEISDLGAGFRFSEHGDEMWLFGGEKGHTVLSTASVWETGA
jgi:hypothetical protein